MLLLSKLNATSLTKYMKKNAISLVKNKNSCAKLFQWYQLMEMTKLKI